MAKDGRSRPRVFVNHVLTHGSRSFLGDNISERYCSVEQFNIDEGGIISTDLHMDLEIFETYVQRSCAELDVLVLERVEVYGSSHENIVKQYPRGLMHHVVRAVSNHREGVLRATPKSIVGH